MPNSPLIQDFLVWLTLINPPPPLSPLKTTETILIARPLVTNSSIQNYLKKQKAWPHQFGDQAFRVTLHVSPPLFDLMRQWLNKKFYYPDVVFTSQETRCSIWQIKFFVKTFSS